MPATLGYYAMINNTNKYKPLMKHRKFLDKVYVDIVYIDCFALRGFCYAIVLVDVGTLLPEI
jgi:hypothetical protein